MRNNINDSLNLLKQLEVRLKTQHTQKLQASKLRIQHNQTTAVKNPKHWGQRCTAAYEHVENELKQENRQLKRYVNRLVKMNEYLKNQLVQGDHFGRKEDRKNEREEKEIKMLRVEVEYLRELNREKQLQIQFLRHKEQRKTKKKSLFTEVTQQSYSSQKRINTTNRHRRQVSSKLSVGKKSEPDYSFVRPSSSKTKLKCRLCYE